jgi:hypothetical protein
VPGSSRQLLELPTSLLACGFSKDAGYRSGPDSGLALYELPAPRCRSAGGRAKKPCAAALHASVSPSLGRLSAESSIRARAALPRR